MLASPSRYDWVAAGVPGLLSVVIPAHNEAENLRAVVPVLLTALHDAGIDHEILIVNDNSTDATHDVLVELAGRHPSVRFIDNPPPKRAVQLLVGQLDPLAREKREHEQHEKRQPQRQQ